MELRRILFITTLLVIISVANASCVTRIVCNDSDPSVGNCSHVQLVDCQNVSRCIRPVDYWILHLDEWPTTTNNYCRHTWQNILLEDLLNDITAFPMACQSLARVLITLRLNELAGTLDDNNLINIMDSADLEVQSCCTNPSGADLTKIHQLYSLLAGSYVDMQSSYCLFEADGLSEESIAWHQVVYIIGVGVAFVFIFIASIKGFQHYFILCRTGTTPLQQTNTSIMLLKEKRSCYYIVPYDDDD